MFSCARGTGAGHIFKTPLQPVVSVSLGAQPVLSDVHWQLFSELFADVHRIFVEISYSWLCRIRGGGTRAWRREGSLIITDAKIWTFRLFDITSSGLN